MVVIAVDHAPRILSKVVEITKTGEIKKNEQGTEWEKCIFTVELNAYSKRTPKLIIPSKYEGRRVMTSRYCLYDWHFKVGVNKTLSPKETQAVLNGKTDLTI